MYAGEYECDEFEKISYSLWETKESNARNSSFSCAAKPTLLIVN